MDIEQLTKDLNRNQITVIRSEHLAPKTMIVSDDIWGAFKNHNAAVEATDEESVKNMLEHP